MDRVADTIDLGQGPLALLTDAVLRSYSQVLFCRSHVVGLLLLLATATSPRLLVSGALAVLLATATARLLSLSEDQIRAGLFGYNALLVALGATALLPGTAAAAGLTALAVVASVFVTAALNSALGSTFNLPVLTWPFLVIFPLTLAAANSMGLAVGTLPADPVAATLSLPAPLTLLLQSLGAVFFVPRVDAGLLVLLALASYSRIAVLLAVMGFGMAQVMGLSLVTPQTGLLPVVLGYNFIMLAVALGGVWFVPSISSFVFAAAGVLVGGLITFGLLPFLTFNGMPPLILPFNLTVMMLLYAMRQRTQDRRPKAVDFMLGTPEENLNYFRTRLSRFSSRYAVRLSAPFLGRWVCTQGVDGDRTHQGPWRHAFDFEVQGPDGRTHKGSGRGLGDFHCYKLPVLATADGTVVKVVDGVPDNPVGQVNLRDNWGNLVLLYHGPGLYSMVCHLAPGSVKVQQGAPVRKGDQLGLCGNSGRSPAPHIHWQLQATARVGAPTLYAELHDVVRQQDGAQRLHGALVLQQGDEVRNLEPRQDVARLLTFTYGQPLRFSMGGTGRDGSQRTEQVVPDIDLFGSLLLRTPGGRGATLYYDAQPSHFTVHDTVGQRARLLQMIQAALSRVPLEASEDLVWSDVLPLRHFLPWWARPGLDLVSPFTRRNGVRMQYRTRRSGTSLVISGRSVQLHGDQPLVETEARLTPELGLESIHVTARGRKWAAHRVGEQTINANSGDPAGIPAILHKELS